MPHSKETVSTQRQSQEYSRRLEMLHATAILINQAESEEQVYKLLLEQLGSVLYFDSAAVLLVEADYLRVVAFIGFPPEYIELGLRIPLTERTPRTEADLHAIRSGGTHDPFRSQHDLRPLLLRGNDGRRRYVPQHLCPGIGVCPPAPLRRLFGRGRANRPPAIRGLRAYCLTLPWT